MASRGAAVSSSRGWAQLRSLADLHASQCVDDRGGGEAEAYQRGPRPRGRRPPPLQPCSGSGHITAFAVVSTSKVQWSAGMPDLIARTLYTCWGLVRATNPPVVARCYCLLPRWPRSSIAVFLTRSRAQLPAGSVR